jgi:hypothetical protein
MATWAEFAYGRMPQGMLDRMRAAEKAEADAFEAEQTERAYARETAARMAQARENSLLYTTGHTSEEWREAAQRSAAAREMRNMQAEYGSMERSALFIDGKVIPPREQARPGPWTKDPVQEQLARARAAGNDPFMLEQVRRFDQRQRDAGKPVISRSQTPDTIQCLDCIADGNVTVDEYLAIHHGPDAIPERLVPDHVPGQAPATRKRSGTGWPVIVR